MSSDWTETLVPVGKRRSRSQKPRKPESQKARIAHGVFLARRPGPPQAQPIHGGSAGSAIASHTKNVFWDVVIPRFTMGGGGGPNNLAKCRVSHPFGGEENIREEHHFYDKKVL
ncbi:hypothetical protein MGYG_00749 [Nannizzia gypsea CBS 118893]|uniref:Uncharacterized protein n=1 Tax=Arthroderma gypseum (strain ATCC MYA-4604 / CBS 118893) TaxID=535722 RepID=E5R1L1_ARTGP|nr:hypothetical protein MGYG_00749 [Nannizzia gypsea CBS 118893]EFQ97709.1 hypothetical protein MGYG_00749 [Nannizzia gypsea CBS 118893]